MCLFELLLSLNKLYSFKKASNLKLTDILCLLTKPLGVKIEYVIE